MKQMEVTEKAIGDYIFYLKPFPAFTAANISGDIVSVILPIVGALVTNGDASQTDVNGIRELAGAMSGLTGDQVEKLVRKLLIDYRNVSYEPADQSEKVRILGQDQANEVFCGNVWEMYVLCWEVLKLNYSGFFERLGVNQSGSLQEFMQMTQRSGNGEPSTPPSSQNSK